MAQLVSSSFLLGRSCRLHLRKPHPIPQTKAGVLKMTHQRLGSLLPSRPVLRKTNNPSRLKTSIYKQILLSSVSVDCDSGAFLLPGCAQGECSSCFLLLLYYTPPIACCWGEEEWAGKFDGNYLAVSLYNVVAGDVRGGGIYFGWT